MDANFAQPVWTGRVRYGVKNSCKYNKDCEVTCKFSNAKDKSDIFHLLKDIEFAPNNFEGVATRPGQLVYLF